MQKKTSFKTPLNCKNRSFAYVQHQLEQQKLLLQQVQAILPEALSKQVRHCLVKDQKLVIFTDSATWASQLRFYQKIILANIEQLTRTPIASIQVKLIREQTGPSLQRTVQAIIPSLATISFIQNQSLDIEDQSLKTALLKLSTTLKRLSDTQ